jgi:hypothetical protein
MARQQFPGLSRSCPAQGPLFLTTAHGGPAPWRQNTASIMARARKRLVNPSMHPDANRETAALHLQLTNDQWSLLMGCWRRRPASSSGFQCCQPFTGIVSTTVAQNILVQTTPAEEERDRKTAASLRWWLTWSVLCGLFLQRAAGASPLLVSHPRPAELYGVRGSIPEDRHAPC